VAQVSSFKALQRLRRLRAHLPPDDKLSSFVRTWLPWAALAGLFSGGILMFFQLQPHTLPTPSNPSFLDNIFASRTVIWATRMLLFVGAVYVAGSVVALIAQNKWLSDFGPFGTSEAFETLEQKLKPFIDQAEKLTETNESLTKRLEAADLTLEELTEERDRIREKIAKIKPPGQSE
jgi:hypothetical protein